MMWLFILISLITVFEAQGQLNTTQTGGITNGVESQNAQPILNNADAIKVAETLVNTANQLLSILKRGSGGSTTPPTEKDVYYGGLTTLPPYPTTDAFSIFTSATRAPAALCPNGQPQAQCDPDPCMAWDCANIAGVQCERTCDSCNPVFTTRGRDVTAICELRRIQRPIQMMPAPISPFDTFASEVISALDLDFLPGDYLDKLRDHQSQSSTSSSKTGNGNEENIFTSDQAKQNKKIKKKAPKKMKRNKMSKEMRKIIKSTTTTTTTTTTPTPVPRVLRKPEIRRGQTTQSRNVNETELLQDLSKNTIYQPVHQTQSVLSSLVDQIPLSALMHLLPGVHGLTGSKNAISNDQPTPLDSAQHVRGQTQQQLTLQPIAMPEKVIKFKNKQTQLLPLSPSQFSRINSHPNRNAILQSLRDILGARPMSHMLQNPIESGRPLPEVRQSSNAQNQRAVQNNVLDTNIPFQTKGRGPLKFFN